MADKVAIASAMWAIRREHGTREDLDRITMLDWLREKHQTERAIQRFWNQVLVSAVNEDLDRMAASHGFQVFWLGFLARADAYEMGIPAVPLGELYGPEEWKRFPTVRLHPRAPVERVITDRGAIRGVIAAGEQRSADYYISALPFERLAAVIPELDLDLEGFEHSPITGIHLWFDRSITELPHATLLDRTVQWMFNKSGGRYLQLVVSASRSLVEMPRAEVIALAVRELTEFFPLAKEAKLEKAHVVKRNSRNVFRAPRPGASAAAERHPIRNLFLAGDWTRSGWPPIMEGAVRSGYLAAEAVTRAAGRERKFLLPDIA